MMIDGCFGFIFYFCIYTCSHFLPILAFRRWNHSQVSTFVVDSYNLYGIFFLKDYESLHEQLSDLLCLDQLGRWSVVLIYKIRSYRNIVATVRYLFYGLVFLLKVEDAPTVEPFGKIRAFTHVPVKPYASASNLLVDCLFEYSFVCNLLLLLVLICIL